MAGGQSPETIKKHLFHLNSIKAWGTEKGLRE